MARSATENAEWDGRKTVGINSETVTNLASTDFPGHFVGEDGEQAWDAQRFKRTFSVKYYKNDAYDASFSLVGIDASIANAFRRILLAEIPVLAIEKVFYLQNTSIIQDEVLAHRLGLVPLMASAEGLRWLATMPPAAPEDPPPETDDKNTIMLRLNVACTWNSQSSDNEDDPTEMYHNAHVYAKDLEWVPIGRQAEVFKDGGVKAVNPDILLAKLRPGQEIELEAHCVKGFGADHAKFSPVATATYRLLPTIHITSPIVGQDAIKFQACFPKGVIGLEDVTEEEASQMNIEYDGMLGQQKAVVKDAFRDTVSREVLRHDEFREKVKLGRVRDHFIFSVESTGQIRSDELFLQAVEVLKLKCAGFRRELEKKAEG